MSRKNMSDIIEEYLKTILKNHQQLEIKRSDIAEYFDCVPSQINYVINTRFTQEHGYVVESKRGGGGYIRILKVHLVDDVDQFDQMLELIGNRLSQRSAENMINTLVANEVLSEREAKLIKIAIDKTTLQHITNYEQEVRSYLMRQFLEDLRLSYPDS